MAESVELREAVAGLVNDGDTVALEGFTHLIPFAAAHEVMRQKKRGLTRVRMTPDLIYDQMIGMNTASKLIFSWGGNPDLGILRPDPETREFTLFSLHPGATVGQTRKATGWDLEVAKRLDETEPPTGEELEILRDLRARTEASRQRPKS